MKELDRHTFTINLDPVVLVRELAEARFFGSLEIKFEAGKVVLVRKTETLK
jgi:hypothetical protein